MCNILLPHTLLTVERSHGPKTVSTSHARDDILGSLKEKENYCTTIIGTYHEYFTEFLIYLHFL